MSDVEQRARDALNEACGARHHFDRSTRDNNWVMKAMCRQIEAHDATKADFEAFRREVSDAVKMLLAKGEFQIRRRVIEADLSRFILPEPVDPYEEEIEALIAEWESGPMAPEMIRKAFLRGLTITERQP